MLLVTFILNVESQTFPHVVTKPFILVSSAVATTQVLFLFFFTPGHQALDHTAPGPLPE